LTPLNFDPIIILALALALDVAFGEPPEKVHLTVWMGKFIEHSENLLRLIFRNERLAGSVLALATIALFTAVTFAAAWAAKLYSWPAYIIVSAVILKMTFALRCMFSHVMPIMKNLTKDIESSRRLLSKVVRRSTEGIDERLVVSGAVETVAEGFVDGFISPIFFYVVLGLPGAVAYRAINTLDSMVGYRDDRYLRFGWLSAKLDSVFNWVPARLSFPLFAISAFLLRLDWRGSVRITLRDHSATPSLNAGWSMSPMAGALRVQLEKEGRYRLGDGIEDLSAGKILDSLKIFTISVSIVISLVVIAYIFGGILLEANSI